MLDKLVDLQNMLKAMISKRYIKAFSQSIFENIQDIFTKTTSLIITRLKLARQVGNNSSNLTKDSPRRVNATCRNVSCH